MANSEENKIGITKHEIETLARSLFPEIYKFFQSDEGRREFEEWKAQQAKIEHPSE